MNKGILPAILLGGALFSAPALAAKNVANTSQKGSLLIYPAISVDPEDGTDTIVEISNDENAAVQIECYYINEEKDRVNFDFFLTPKQTVSWDVGTGAGEINPPPFPSGSLYTPGPGYVPVDPNRGELVCFATDTAVQNQIAFNHLIGSATIVNLDDSDADQGLQAFRYNAWAFAAESSTATPPADGTKMGKPGQLVLSGAGTGTYDACPQYNIVNFMPGEGVTTGSGASLGSVYTIDNDLTIASCNQDLRQDFQLHLTKLQFTVWNANETSYTGAYACVDSVNEVSLDPIDAGSSVHDVTNFTHPVLTTTNARFQVQGVASTQCPNSESAAMIGVLTSSLNLDGGDAGAFFEDAEVGSTTQGAGAQAGYVLWDPFGSVPTPQAPTHH